MTREIAQKKARGKMCRMWGGMFNLAWSIFNIQQNQKCSCGTIFVQTQFLEIHAIFNYCFLNKRAHRALGRSPKEKVIVEPFTEDHLCCT